MSLLLIVNRNAFFKHHPDDFNVVTFYSEVHRRDSVRMQVVKLGALSVQLLQDADVAFISRDSERGNSVVFSNVKLVSTL